MGVVSPVGIGVAAYRNAILEGRSGVRAITEFKADDMPVKIAGLVQNLDTTGVLDESELIHTNRATRLALVAAKEAMGADVEDKLQDRTRVGALMGVCSGGMEVLTRELDLFWNQGPAQLTPNVVPMLMDNSASAWISLKYGLRGPSYCLATACATSMDCLGIAADLIRAGRVDAMLAGGGDAAVTRFAISAFANARALSRNNDNPSMASRPFDTERDGFVMGEAAVLFFLERRDRAEKRGAKIFARLAGYGASNDAHHIASPRPDGAGLIGAMQLACEQAGISTKDIGYISAHATSTEQGDVAEATAIRTAMNGHADNVLVGATKSIVGHSLGGAGGISSTAAIFAVNEGILTPCVSLRTLDPQCNINVLSQTKTGQSVKYALANAAGFGGQNSTLVFGQP